MGDADRQADQAPAPMRAIDRAMGHFSRRQAVRIEVDQWTDDQGRPLVVMATPLNLRQQDELDRMNRRYKTFELMAHILIRFAKDEQCQPLFTLSDKHALMENVDPEVLADLAYRITNPVAVDDLKKNS